MQENKLTVIINRTVEDLFEFTTNPKNTPLWIASITKEVSDGFPPKVGTQYKNCGKNSVWDLYKVTEYEAPKIFSLTDLEENYHVRYAYTPLNGKQTELEYFEWMKEGELKNPFPQTSLNKLKSIIDYY